MALHTISIALLQLLADGTNVVWLVAARWRCARFQLLPAPITVRVPPIRSIWFPMRFNLFELVDFIEITVLYFKLTRILHWCGDDAGPFLKWIIVCQETYGKLSNSIEPRLFQEQQLNQRSWQNKLTGKRIIKNKEAIDSSRWRQ